MASVSPARRARNSARKAATVGLAALALALSLPATGAAASWTNSSDPTASWTNSIDADASWTNGSAPTASWTNGRKAAPTASWTNVRAPKASWTNGALPRRASR